MYFIQTARNFEKKWKNTCKSLHKSSKKDALKIERNMEKNIEKNFYYAFADNRKKIISKHHTTVQGNSLKNTNFLCKKLKKFF